MEKSIHSQGNKLEKKYLSTDKDLHFEQLTTPWNVSLLEHLNPKFATSQRQSNTLFLESLLTSCKVASLLKEQ